MPQIDAIRFRKYKSFGEEYSTIPLKRMTVLIGRNNSGKSSCLDVIEAMTCFKSLNRHSVIIQALLIDEKTDSIEQQKSGRRTNTRKSLGWFNIIPTVGERSTSFRIEPKPKSKKNLSVHFINNQLENTKIVYYRLNSERDILPEKDGDGVFLHSDGSGATNLIQHILNAEGQDEQLIYNVLLKDINEIMRPDTHFSNIGVKKIDDSRWEVFLYEKNKPFALSKMGSGLKTVILVLLNLIVLPKVKNFSLYNADYHIYAFEELENNLHPALQRRLFKFIEEYVQKTPNAYIFLTTHSHIPINLFTNPIETNNNSDVQILQIIKKNGLSSIHTVESFIDKNEVMSDLGVRASDLLQSNGIIWVEGPSDHIYIKHWMKIWGGDKLCEGVDYQFLYYGGRLLSHYTADSSIDHEEQVDENLIEILKINRNAIIVMDSDITEKRPAIHKTKGV